MKKTLLATSALAFAGAMAAGPALAGRRAHGSKPAAGRVPPLREQQGLPQGGHPRLEALRRLTRRMTAYGRGWWPFITDNAPREDETRSLSVSAHNRGLTLWGFSPRVSLVRESRESNAQLHNYERTSGELQFVRLF